MSETSSKKLERRMTALALNLKDHLIGVAGERGWNETREAWLARAARKCGISFRTARSIFYDEMRDPKFSVVQKVLAARHQQNIDNSKKAEEAYQNAMEQIVECRRLLSQSQPHVDCSARVDDFYGVGAVDCTVDHSKK